MSRRRKQLEVSTFPFLAVLLCAMGSLILVLLVFDRKAKLAARQKAERQAAQLAEEQYRALEERRAEMVRRRAEREQSARLALETKRKELGDELTTEEMELQKQWEQIAAWQAEAFGKLKQGREQIGKLTKDVDQELARIAEQELALAQMKSASTGSETDTEAARAAAARLAADIARMESNLGELRATRSRQERTYSVVPYKGTRGDDRRPLYLECTSRGIILHPDRMEITELLDGPVARMEIERRVDRQREQFRLAKVDDTRPPYFLVLVRPDGISTYYDVQTLLRSMKIDFGYEFVDASWLLDFPEDGLAPTQSWLVNNQTPTVPKADPPTGPRPTGLSPKQPVLVFSNQPSIGSSAPRGDVPAVGLAPPVVPGSTGPGTGTGSADKADSGPPGNGSSGPSALAGTGTKRGSSGTEDTVTPGATTNGGTKLRGLPPVAPGREPGLFPSSQGSGTGTSGPFRPNVDGAMPNGGPGASGDGGTPGGQQGTGNGSSVPPAPGSPASGPRAVITGVSGDPGGSQSGTPGANNGAPTGTASPGTPGSPRPDGSSVNAGSARPPGAPPSPDGSSSNPASIRPPDVPPPDGSNSNPTNVRPPGSPSPYSSNANPSSVRPPGTPPPDGTSGTANGSRTPVIGIPQGSGQQGEPPIPGTGPGGTNIPGLPPPANRERKAPILRPARVNDREWTVYLECRSDGVVLYPARTFIPANALTGTGTTSPLQTAVQQMIDRRQAQVPPGQAPYRPQVQFLIRPDSLRTFYLAYPALDGLSVPKFRRNLQPDEDVREVME
jgi:hypothetical protein